MAGAPPPPPPPSPPPPPPPPPDHRRHDPSSAYLRASRALERSIARVAREQGALVPATAFLLLRTSRRRDLATVFIELTRRIFAHRVSAQPMEALPPAPACASTVDTAPKDAPSTSASEILPNMSLEAPQSVKNGTDADAMPPMPPPPQPASKPRLCRRCGQVKKGHTCTNPPPKEGAKNGSNGSHSNGSNGSSTPSPEGPSPEGPTFSGGEFSDQPVPRIGRRQPDPDDERRRARGGHLGGPPR